MHRRRMSWTLLRKYGLLAVPVVTEGSRLVGIVTFDDVMSHL
ncbi:CBS domain-containing protein [Paenibacillus sp. E194]